MHEEFQKFLLGTQDAQTALGKVATELENRMVQYLKDNPGATVEQPKGLSD